MPQVRIILRGGRLDLKTELSLYDPVEGKEARWGYLCGPRQEDIDAAVRTLKDQCERSGSQVEVVKYKT